MRPVSVIVVVALLVVAVGAAWAAHVAVRDQERRLLKERTSEVGLVLSEAIGAIPASLTTLGDVLQATDSSLQAFQRAAAAEVAAAAAGQGAYALLRPFAGGGFVVVAEAGRGLAVGEVVSDVRAGTLAAALRSQGMLATPVIGSGAQRTIGYALGPPVAPAGTVLYRQSALGPVKAPRSSNTAPYHEVRIAVYASPTVNPQQLLVATTASLPLRGTVRSEALPAGNSHWLLVAAATQPLVGSLAANAQWYVLAVGLAVVFLSAVAIVSEGRRRAAAVALYATEHQVAETLQRSLLPELPELDGLEVAARYVAGDIGHQVGGDWFDVFELDAGRVGIVIGDVVGHDIVAAAAMSQVRATLRAYAWQGDDPSAALDRLDRLISAFSVTQLVTVFYGVLEAPARDGARILRYANAGHLPPLVRTPEGRIEELAPVSSLIIGVPAIQPRTEREHNLLPGSTLVLFTDGLVEVRGISLDDSLGELERVLSGIDMAASMEALCETIVASSDGSERHDDVAILAIRTTASAVDSARHDATPLELPSIRSLATSSGRTDRDARPASGPSARVS